jgi:hypothetical protein
MTPSEVTPLLLIALFNALHIIGLHLSTGEGMINYWVHQATAKLPNWLTKPLFDCPTCMASIHSTYFYWYFADLTWVALLAYPFYITAVAGISTLINSLINR